MIRQEIEKLEYLSATMPGLLRQIDEQSFSYKPAENIQSKKEIIGHLIDCATNNHQSLASCQHHHGLPIFYDLHNWNKFGYYRHCSQPQIIALWERSNLQLLEIIRSLQEVDLKRKYLVGAKSLTVRSLIRKYIKDLEAQLADVLASGLATEPGILTSPLNLVRKSEMMMAVKA
ncbi:hypothetical protein GZH53_01525 [Flavihumibacter sp. R14]|nr:hypothetical protein [Flavihumibacter soli]